MSKTSFTVLTAIFVSLCAVILLLGRHFLLEVDVFGPSETGTKRALFDLVPSERFLVKFLLLLPLGALVVSAFRALVGVPMFGSFAPVLLGLAFLDLKSLPFSLGIFVATVLIGWRLRWFVDFLHLLQVSRFSALLTLIVGFLIALITAASQCGVQIAQHVSLFPLAILTHMAERFWTLEAEDGTAMALRTLLGTAVASVCVSLTLSPETVTTSLFSYPEIMGFVLAAHLLLGRYTGYRLSELYRFRNVLDADVVSDHSESWLTDSSDGFENSANTATGDVAHGSGG